MELGSRGEQPRPVKDSKGRRQQSDLARRQRPSLMIHEKENVVVVGGVALQKSEVVDSPLVPEKGEKDDFRWDRVTADMAQYIAVSWRLGHRPLIETGTGIGKSTLIRKLGELLGAEVHYYNCKGTTDASDFMGDFTVNEEKKTEDDPAYVFSPGPVTEALTTEEGKIKILFLDEMNFTSARELAALHEVMDTLDRDGKIVVNNKVIQTDHTKTFVVACVNPPGGNFIGRDALDPALIRRWNYYKGPNELPDDVSQEVLAYTWEQSSLTQEEGFTDLLGSYWKFHKWIQRSVDDREFADQQSQPFTFNDREEFERVCQFVHEFYNGNLDDTFRNALRFFYLNKFERPDEKKKIAEMINKVGSVEGLLYDSEPDRSDSGLFSDPSPRSIFERPEVTSVNAIPSPRSQRRDTNDSSRPQEFHEKKTPRETPQQYIESRERERLSGMYGPGVEVKPLPDCVSTEVIKNLEAAGLALRYLPAIDLDPEGLQTKTVTDYLADLAERYPQFARMEDLSNSEKANPDIPRLMERWFFQNVQMGNIEFPQLPGRWVAVETVDKPERGEYYNESPMQKALRVKKGRTYERPNLLRSEIRKKEDQILRKLGVAGRAELRLLEAVEYTFLGNGEGWGKEDMYELTNTLLTDTDDLGNPRQRTLASGSASEGGVGHFAPIQGHEASQFVGYRLGIFFEP